jgi:predicted transposase/invertase (TIGR01784 family)
MVGILVANFIFKLPDLVYRRCYESYDVLNKEINNIYQKLYIIEIPKVLNSSDSSLLIDFLHFLGSKSWEDIMTVAKNHPALEEGYRTFQSSYTDKEELKKALESERERAFMEATIKTSFHDGKIEGMAEGMAKGRAEERRTLIKIMLPELGIEKVSELTGLPVEEVARIVAES